MDACVYVKDRMEEVSSPDKEMVRILFLKILVQMIDGSLLSAQLPVLFLSLRDSK